MILITRMALEEMAKRKKLGANQIDRIDLLGSLMTANEKAPDVFGEGDVFAIAHGAMFVFFTKQKQTLLADSLMQYGRFGFDSFNDAIVLPLCPP